MARFIQGVLWYVGASLLGACLGVVIHKLGCPDYWARIIGMAASIAIAGIAYTGDTNRGSY